MSARTTADSELQPMFDLSSPAFETFVARLFFLKAWE